MNYIIQEVYHDENDNKFKLASFKAREDIDTVLLENGFTSIQIPVAKRENTIQKAEAHMGGFFKWKKVLSSLKRGDKLVFQFPFYDRMMLFDLILGSLRKKGVKIYFVIHDLVSLRELHSKNNNPPLSRFLRYMEEKGRLKYGSKIIVHNEKMKEYMLEQGYSQKQFINLEIFDYLIPGKINHPKCENFSTLMVAGNLNPVKSGYIYQLPDELKVNLFGVNYQAQQMKSKHANYLGSFPPDDLPFILEGGFGLVWDGPTAKTCEGAYGEYLRYNNPHKTSLYLASGFPVVIWKEAALAGFIQKNGLGICVDSLYDLPGALGRVTKEEHEKMIQNAEEMGKRLREGYYIKKAMKLEGI